MLQLMIPAVVAQVVNLLYNIVDRIYIGHIAGIGAAALTGVGLFTPILMLLNAFAMLVGAGGAPRTAIALGQGDKEQAEKIISNSFTMLLLFSVVLTVVFYAGAPTCCGSLVPVTPPCPMRWRTAASTFWARCLCCWCWA